MRVFKTFGSRSSSNAHESITTTKQHESQGRGGTHGSRGATEHLEG